MTVGYPNHWVRTKEEKWMQITESLLVISVERICRWE